MPARPSSANRSGALGLRLSESRSRAERLLALWIEQARAWLGIRRGVHHAGVYFKELSAQRLARALSARGGGAKDYRVTFPDGSKQIIRCTRERCYADVMGPEQLHRLGRAAEFIRPGSRILEIASSPMLTGYSGAWLARMAGESGAVVSLIADEEGARFGAARYAAPNLSIERLAGPLADALAGETDGAFHAVVHLGLAEDPAAREGQMRELWRVLAPGGWMLAGVRLTDNPSDEAIGALRRHLAQMGLEMDAEAASGKTDKMPVIDVLLRKQGDEPDRV